MIAYFSSFSKACMLILVSKCSWSAFLNPKLWITPPTSSSIFTKINYSHGLWCKNFKKNSPPQDSILKADTTWVNIKNTVQIAKGNTHLLLICRLLYPRIMLYLQVQSVGSNINPGFSWCTSSNKQTSALGGAALQKNQMKPLLISSIAVWFLGLWWAVRIYSFPCQLLKYAFVWIML